MTLNKQKTALLSAYKNQVNDEVSRFMYAAPFITDTDYNAIVDDLDVWIPLANAGNLTGTNENNTTFTFGGIDSDTPRPKR
jgi:hypothetical protein